MTSVFVVVLAFLTFLLVSHTEWPNIRSSLMYHKEPALCVWVVSWHFVCGLQWKHAIILMAAPQISASDVYVRLRSLCLHLARGDKTTGQITTETWWKNVVWVSREPIQTPGFVFSLSSTLWDRVYSNISLDFLIIHRPWWNKIIRRIEGTDMSVCTLVRLDCWTLTEGGKCTSL